MKKVLLVDDKEEVRSTKQGKKWSKLAKVRKESESDEEEVRPTKQGKRCKSVGKLKHFAIKKSVEGTEGKRKRGKSSIQEYSSYRDTDSLITLYEITQENGKVRKGALFWKCDSPLDPDLGDEVEAYLNRLGYLNFKTGWNNIERYKILDLVKFL